MGIIAALIFYWLTWYRFSRKQYTFTKSIFEINGRTVIYQNRLAAKFNGWGLFKSALTGQPIWFIGWFDHWEQIENSNYVYLALNDKPDRQLVKIRINITKDDLGTDFRVDNLSRLPAQEPEKMGLIVNYGKAKFMQEMQKGDVVVAVVRWNEQYPFKDINNNFQATQIIVRRFVGKQDL